VLNAARLIDKYFIKDSIMEQLEQAAKIGFASTFSFALKAQNFHWNIEGSDFLEYHELFGKIYEEVYGSVDDFAEKIRALGTYVPASLSRFSMLSQVDDETSILPQQSMIQELLADNEKIVKVLMIVYHEAEDAGEHGFSNFIAERMDAHRKHGWMLRASSKV
jgi:starvation-inducible DNA-binding protein